MYIERRFLFLFPWCHKSTYYTNCIFLQHESETHPIGTAALVKGVHCALCSRGFRYRDIQISPCVSQGYHTCQACSLEDVASGTLCSCCQPASANKEQPFSAASSTQQARSKQGCRQVGKEYTCSTPEEPKHKESHPQITTQEKTRGKNRYSLPVCCKSAQSQG